jgi:hypothetical protein
VIVCLGVEGYLRGLLWVVEISPRMAPTSTNVPPRLPAMMPNTSRMMAQVRFETYLEPVMHTAPIMILMMALMVPLNTGSNSRARRKSMVTPSSWRAPERTMIIPPISASMYAVCESEEVMCFRVCLWRFSFFGFCVYRVPKPDFPDGACLLRLKKRAPG